MVYVTMLVFVRVNRYSKVLHAIALDQYLAVITACATTEYANVTETLVDHIVKNVKKPILVLNVIFSVIHLDPL